MKFASCVLKILALALAIAAVACSIIAYWDKIEACAYRVRQRVSVQKCDCDDADYEDWVD